MYLAKAEWKLIALSPWELPSLWLPAWGEQLGEEVEVSVEAAGLLLPECFLRDLTSSR